MNIKDLEIGKSAKITKVGGEGALRQHFLDMGLIPGAQITMIKFAPMGDPVEIKIHGYELTLRLAAVLVSCKRKGQLCAVGQRIFVSFCVKFASFT